MMKFLLHIWRSLVEPSHDSYLFGFNKGGWQVIYNEGGRSIEMPYLTACDYAEIFGGVVVRYIKRYPNSPHNICQDLKPNENK